MKKKVLVVDDEKGIRDLFCFFLAPEDFAVYPAENGMKAIEILKKDEFDIVFLDIHMPIMGGYETLKIIKQIKPDQTVIIFSSNSDPNFILESNAMEIGAFDCLYKPFNIEDVLKMIEKATIQKKAGSNET